VLSRAFTLIELLVVITIIVVLLALLTPALDRAVYSAELTVCAARLSAIGVSAQTYATGSRRHYPYRAAADGSIPYERFTINDGAGHDDRPVLRQCLSLNQHLNDALVGRIDIDGSKPTTWIILPTSLYFGTRIKGEAGMFRLGDRWGWTGADAIGNPREYRFRTLVSDNSYSAIQPQQNYASHPDSDGLLTKVIDQDGTSGAVLAAAAALHNNGVTDLTDARWHRGGTPQRGTEDLNYGFDDGSVLRFDAVRWNEPQLSGRMVEVPTDLSDASTSIFGFRDQVPVR
jgi:prepilin-type N-terminal cleavage/methylation domain-containing protein